MARRRPAAVDVAGAPEGGAEMLDRWAALAEERRGAIAAAAEAGALVVTAEHVAVARLALDGAVFLAYGEVVAGSRRHPLTDGFWVLAGAQDIADVVRATPTLDDAARVLTHAVRWSRGTACSSGDGPTDGHRRGRRRPWREAATGRVERGDWGPFGEGWVAIRPADAAQPDPVVLAGAPVYPSRRRAARALAGR
jgi:hypothetical protein